MSDLLDLMERATPKPLPGPKRPSLADLTQGRRNRDEAMRVAAENAATTWKARAYAAIARVCHERESFICDAVWDYVEKPAEARALGALMRSAAHAGLCERTNEYRPSEQPGSNCVPRVVWRSLVFRGA